MVTCTLMQNSELGSLCFNLVSNFWEIPNAQANLAEREQSWSLPCTATLNNRCTSSQVCTNPMMFTGKYAFLGTVSRYAQKEKQAVSWGRFRQFSRGERGWAAAAGGAGRALLRRAPPLRARQPGLAGAVCPGPAGPSPQRPAGEALPGWRNRRALEGSCLTSHSNAGRAPASWPQALLQSPPASFRAAFKRNLTATSNISSLCSATELPGVPWGLRRQLWPSNAPQHLSDLSFLHFLTHFSIEYLLKAHTIE